jgi:hypothetical protein
MKRSVLCTTNPWNTAIFPLPRIKEFTFYLPRSQPSSTSNDQDRSAQPTEKIKAEAFTTNQILCWPHEAQKTLKAELRYVISSAFPKMPEETRAIFVNDYFQQLTGGFSRQAILCRNEADKLLASTVFDCGLVEYEGNILRGIYLITRTILSEYQGKGIGKIFAQKVLMELQPDILFVTCAQSSALHSWVKLPQKGLIQGYEVYPRLERQNDGTEVLRTVPYKELDLAITVFQQLYLGVIVGDQQEGLKRMIQNLTILMVRKHLFGAMYDFNPWGKKGKEDTLAKALGAKDKDGILVMFRKKSP